MENFDKRVANVLEALDSCLPDRKRNEESEQGPHSSDSRECDVPPHARSRSPVRPPERPRHDSPTQRHSLHRRDRSHNSRDNFIPVSAARAERHSRRSHSHTKPFPRNPNKWTKYDLSDDGTKVLKGMSEDQVNKYAAFQFLDNLKKQRKSDIEGGARSSKLGLESDSTRDGLLAAADLGDHNEEPAKIVFRRRTAKGTKSNEPTIGAGEPTSRNHDRSTQGSEVQDEGVEDRTSRAGGGVVGSIGAGVIRMPEYVVGSKLAAAQNLKKKRKRGALCLVGSVMEGRDAGSDVKRTRTAAVINLSHLEEEED